MQNLLICLRALQIIAHHYHNVCGKIAFHQDHEFFGEVYSAAESDYDSVIERIIGKDGVQAINLDQILSQVSAKIKPILKSAAENKAYYEALLAQIEYINSEIQKLIDGKLVSRGTEQLIGEIANKNEILIYKIKRRIA
jgi:DNA-binding ferritin-like protein